MPQDTDNPPSDGGLHSATRVKSSVFECAYCEEVVDSAAGTHACSQTPKMPLPHGIRATELAERIAATTGLKYLGVLSLSRPGSVTLRFPSGLDLARDPPWPEHELDDIGKPVGIYIIPSSRLMGIRGHRGDVLMTYVDIQRYRYRDVFRHLTGAIVD